MDELIKSWKSANDQRLERAELNDLLEKGLSSNAQEMKMNMRMDLFGALGVALICILLAFLLELEYRWIVVSAMLGFAVLILVHYNIKYRLLKLGSLGDIPLSSTIMIQYSRIRSYKNFYFYFTPVLAVAPLLVFMNLYTQTSLLTQLSLVIFVGLLTLGITKILWTRLYAPFERRIVALRKIRDHLNGRPFELDNIFLADPE